MKVAAIIEEATHDRLKAKPGDPFASHSRARWNASLIWLVISLVSMRRNLKEDNDEQMVVAGSKKSSINQYLPDVCLC